MNTAKINLKKDKIDTTKAATYVWAAAFKTTFAPLTSVSSNMPALTREDIALLEALNSTGKVISEKITEMPKKIMPAQRKISPKYKYEKAESKIPIITSGHKRREVIMLKVAITFLAFNGA